MVVVLWVMRGIVPAVVCCRDGWLSRVRINKLFVGVLLPVRVRLVIFYGRVWCALIDLAVCFNNVEVGEGI